MKVCTTLATTAEYGALITEKKVNVEFSARMLDWATMLK